MDLRTRKQRPRRHFTHPQGQLNSPTGPPVQESLTIFACEGTSRPSPAFGFFRSAKTM
jgi:hypothetical protein